MICDISEARVIGHRDCRPVVAGPDGLPFSPTVIDAGLIVGRGFVDGFRPDALRGGAEPWRPGHIPHIIGDVLRWIPSTAADEWVML